MRRWAALGLLTGVLSMAGTTPTAAQENDFLAVGSDAPDIEFTGATRYGVVGDLRLSEYRGETIVLAFFFRARTPG
ncbi:hypothetical protein [Gaopeijia maritima]|uniref:Alkyl hydroperoxide reductase subunit C/ Thiol specific antioxidant domain-containing protein n=1 Tax=Gaopeijia maritima TaxID=3119007 RepID=A0ABU9EDH4_9BACT